MAIVSIIVLEKGSSWPGHVGDTENVVAAGSDEDGLPARTDHMIGTLLARPRAVRVAVLVCNGATDAASAGRRAEIARSLLRAVGEAAFGRLMLCTGNGASMQLRRELLCLADTLAQDLEGKTTTIALRFGEPGEPRPRRTAVTDGVRVGEPCPLRPA